MPITNFSLFLSITLVVSASPGPVMLSCMSTGGGLGLRKAFVGMIGASLGNLCLVALSALGLGLIVSQNDLLFNLIKWFGSGYLVYLGVQIIRTPITQMDLASAAVVASSKAIGWNAFLIAISNPNTEIELRPRSTTIISWMPTEMLLNRIAHPIINKAKMIRL